MSLADVNPVLLNIPEEFESARLLIRSPLWGDGPMVNEAVKETLEELRPWMPWAQSVPSLEASEEDIRRARLRFLERSDLRLLLLDKHTGRLVGCSGLHRIDWVSRRFEIGYWLRTSCTGMGYMTEAVDAIEQFAIRELEANRIEIRCDSRNLRSAKVAERSGYTLEATLRYDSIAIDGTLRNTMIFAKVRGAEF
ncbi:Protein N-acetyltransferase, RimJ/RimL family [Paenibacillus sp. UNCCL117]|uniref:GNAT family N-acetyltransferase n=1 Tax=unclassified Paenibacillus TaxID=185978 RepID=UPI000889C628|nr:MULTISPECIES: GNAT family N-acetyltransferase [unclassified Paenibacillus]SDD64764.1 Protein N-acetyltransferase, RimJ/RimL family [Paenibacillus sp. cl123]SFW58256.1 Protein N-acetyltransferase, RimJ/RimL family [Paenibacillus sp. UNCCL117]